MQFSDGECAIVYDTCSASEVAKVDAYVNCLGALRDCDPSAPASYDDAIIVCARSTADGLGKSCRAALGKQIQSP